MDWPEKIDSQLNDDLSLGTMGLPQSETLLIIESFGVVEKMEAAGTAVLTRAANQSMGAACCTPTADRVSAPLPSLWGNDCRIKSLT